jgi:hypothetical protein
MGKFFYYLTNLYATFFQQLGRQVHRPGLFKLTDYFSFHFANFHPVPPFPTIPQHPKKRYITFLNSSEKKCSQGH